MRRLTIKLLNRTQYRAGDIRAFIRKAYPLVFDPGQRLVIYCDVKRRRRGGVRGRAIIGGCQMWLSLPPEVPDKRVLGAVVVHELGHLRGLSHAQMRGSPKWTWRGLRDPDPSGRWYASHEWARALPLRKVEARAKPIGLGLVEVRLKATENALARWTSKAKLAATKLRKLRRRLRYYERRAAAIRAEV